MTKLKNQKAKRPNIILIMADDMGYSDIGCYGSEIDTPNLDYLAQDGIRFTRMYNCARCCPSRSSLLTGLYPHQAGIGLMETNVGIPSYQGYLNNHCLTIAEALKHGGYSTAMAGKWHVGGHLKPKEDPESWDVEREDIVTPKQRGFDHFYGTITGCGSYYNPHTLMDEDCFITVPPDEDYYYTDAISKKAVEFIDEFNSYEENPFFMYVSYTAPHWPLHARPEDIAKYEGDYLTGWDEIRKKRYERLVKSGIVNEEWDISPRDESSKPWEEVEHKEWEAKRMAVYAAQIDRMDQGIGMIIDKLKELDINENTLIVFLSDNGGCAEGLREGDFIHKNLVLPTRTGKKLKYGNKPEVIPGPEDTYMSYGLPWANVSNTPFRYYKHFIHEGGISTPLIINWPQGISENNKIVHKTGHVIDIMPTFLDIAKVDYPGIYNSDKVTPLEGQSLISVIENDIGNREKPLAWEHHGNCGIMEGNWKLVKKQDDDWELYNIELDRTELNDLSAKYPERVKKLKKMYSQWADRVGVHPWKEIK